MLSPHLPLLNRLLAPVMICLFLTPVPTTFTCYCNGTVLVSIHCNDLSQQSFNILCSFSLPCPIVIILLRVIIRPSQQFLRTKFEQCCIIGTPNGTTIWAIRSFYFSNVLSTKPLWISQTVLSKYIWITSCRTTISKDPLYYHSLSAMHLHPLVRRILLQHQTISYPWDLIQCLCIITSTSLNPLECSRAFFSAYTDLHLSHISTKVLSLLRFTGLVLQFNILTASFLPSSISNSSTSSCRLLSPSIVTRTCIHQTYDTLAHL